MRIVATPVFAMIALAASNDLAMSAGLDGAYYCAAEAAGGVSYDSVQNTWRGTSFQANWKFGLRMTFVDTRNYKVPVINAKDVRCNAGPCPSHVDLNFDQYQAKITMTGTDKALFCEDYASIGDHSPEQNIVSIGSNSGAFRCVASGREFFFNFVTNRFEMAEMGGSIFWTPNFAEADKKLGLKPSSPSTPYIATGACTKIE